MKLEGWAIGWSALVNAFEKALGLRGAFTICTRQITRSSGGLPIPSSEEILCLLRPVMRTQHPRL